MRPSTRLVLIFIPFTLAGCAGQPLAPEQRKVQVIETSQSDAKTAYIRALAYVAKSWGDSNHAIRMKDEGAAQIIVKGNVTCNVLRQFGDMADYSLAFNLDFQAKDKRVRFSFEDLEMVDKLGKAVPWAYNQISSAEKVEAVKPCLKPVTEGMSSAVRAPASQDW